MRRRSAFGPARAWGLAVADELFDVHDLGIVLLLAGVAAV
jgi:hypothetical protein